MKRIFCLVLVLCMSVCVFASCGKNANNYESKTYNYGNNQSADSNTTTEPYTPMEFESNGTGKFPKVRITVKDYGEIELVLNDEVAPITVENFINLVEDKFYDGLTFHRIIEGFMIQGGDPKGTGLGGSKKTIKGEFSANGVENNISHLRGVISMARSEKYDSASSQFFICHKDSPHLNGQYAAFGTVTKGIEVVDKIATQAKTVDNNGTVLAADQPVIEKIEVIE